MSKLINKCKLIEKINNIDTRVPVTNKDGITIGAGYMSLDEYRQTVLDLITGDEFDDDNEN